MKFKKFIIIIIIILLISLSLAGLIYIFKNYEFLNDEGKTELKNKACLEDLENLSDEQIINKINNLEAGDKEKIKDIKRNMLGYLACTLEQEREEFDKHIWKELYLRIMGLVNDLNISEEVKNKLLGKEILGGMLYRYNQDAIEIGLLSEEYRLPNFVALSPISQICIAGTTSTTDAFLDICLNGGALISYRKDKLPDDVFEEATNRCKNLCKNIIRYQRDWHNFEKDNEEFPWSGDNDLLGVQFLMRSALAYRVGGEDLGLSLCNSIPNSNLKEKENCKLYVKSLEYINCKDFSFNENNNCKLRNYGICEQIYDKAKKSICNLLSVKEIKK